MSKRKFHFRYPLYVFLYIHVFIYINPSIQLGLAKERQNVKNEELRQNSELSLYYEEQLSILDKLRNNSNIIAIEMVTNIFSSIRYEKTVSIY
jgi:hypothetical protein